MNKLLEVSHLTKKYGKKTVLDDVSFTIDSGKIIGILGRNASGKTTLFKILTGLSDRSSGEVRILGQEIGLETRALVSFMPDSADFVKWSRIRDAKQFYQDFYPDYDEAKFHQLLEWLELKEEQKISSLSKGTKERLQLALALSRNARLYILDEPITGVDPIVRDKILAPLLFFLLNFLIAEVLVLFFLNLTHTFNFASITLGLGQIFLLVCYILVIIILGMLLSFTLLPKPPALPYMWLLALQVCSCLRPPVRSYTRLSSTLP